ncbi:MAG TPA: outer membrane protein assembly factor BamA [Blastocatellia bacterium]|nr:outer membrane protein assembly factor BamA [Blastocatellia bacterium]
MSALSFNLRATPVAFQQQQPQAAQQVLIEDVQTRGNRRIPRESILYYVQSKQGDVYSEAQLRRDLEAVLGTGWFDPLKTRLLVEDGPRGGKIVTFQVSEYPIIRDIQYRGLKSATESDILTRFKERRVGVGKDSQLDPAKVNAARNVLRELLAEKGHPDSTVDVEIEDISATAVALIYNISEGQRVRVKEIVFTGQTRFSQRQLRHAMKYIKEAGLLSSLTSKDIYFKDKLEADLQGQLRLFLGNKGYLQAIIGEPKVERAGTVSGGLPVPFLRRSGPGLRITIPIEVGRRYKVAKVDEKGVTRFQPGIITAVSGLKVGEYATAKAIQEGVYKNIKNLYGELGYIEASAEFIPKFIDKTDEEGEVEVTLEVDEGKQFTLRRLEFIGNTNTRDVVMRREVLINEGDPYNKRYWDLSILRLNQLGLFEEIKEKDAATRTNPRDQTVEIDLQVKERGRQQIQLNGGVSGIGGSFFGISYSTNNLLGYGESLEFNVSAGNRQKYFLVGVTEPYFLGRPIQVGVQLFVQEYQFIGQGFNFNTSNQILQASLFGLSSIDADTLFTQRTAGGTISASAPLAIFTNRFRRYSQFTRIGLSYSLSATSLQDPKVNRDADPKNDIPVTFTQPRVLTSRIVPSLSYNTLNSSLDPTRGQSLFLGFSLAGLGGDVHTFAPSLEYKYFIPVLRKRTELPQVLGMRFLAGHVRSFGTPFTTDSFSFVGGVPIYERFFLGGEYDIRGYNIRSIGPLVPVSQFLSTQNVVPKVLDATGNPVALPDDSNIIQKDSSGNIVLNPGSVARAFTFDAPEGACAGLTKPTFVNGRLCNIGTAPSYFTPVGGDTQFVYNIEYRVPLFTQKLQAVAFADVGTAFNARKYSNQIVKTPFIKDQVLTTTQVSVAPSGRIATPDEVANSPSSIFRNVVAVGDTRRYDIVRLSEGTSRVFSDLRSSLGAEIRVQLPVVNVPFRLIFAYNPNAKTSIDPNTNPGIFIFGLERKTVVRFSVGRTF